MLHIVGRLLCCKIPYIMAMSEGQPPKVSEKRPIPIERLFLPISYDIGNNLLYLEIYSLTTSPIPLAADSWNRDYRLCR